MRRDEGKLPIASYADGIKALIGITFKRWRKGDPRPAPSRVYLCPHCMLWHLTRHEYRGRQPERPLFYRSRA